LHIESFLNVAANFKVIFLDSYGVIKNHHGLIPGVPDVIKRLRDEGKVIRVLTNDASRGPEKQSERFAEQGLPGILPQEIITSGMMAKLFLEQKVISGRVAYLGTKDAAQYILDASLHALPVSDLDFDNLDDITALVFLDDEGFDWNRDINKAVNLMRKKNIPAILANSDKLYPVSKNDVSIATGGIAQLVESILGREFIHFGKPDSQMFSYAYEDINRSGNYGRSDILMVGDTLHTDIHGGNKFGIKTALVFSGNTKQDDAQVRIEATGVIPDFMCWSIVD
jgi:HAD superfamily hydrolase (TIGR01450 family)